MPNFGYETKGTASGSDANDKIRGSVFTITENGVATKITAGLAASAGGTANVKCAIYKHSDSTLVPNSETDARLIDVANWPTVTLEEFTISGDQPELVADTPYVLVAWADAEMYLASDVGDEDQGHYDPHAYGEWPDPAVFVLPSTSKFSIFCTYDEVPTVPENTVYLVKATGKRTQLSTGAVPIKIDPATGRRGTDPSLTKFLVREDDGTLRAKSA